MPKHILPKFSLFFFLFLLCTLLIPKINAQNCNGSGVPISSGDDLQLIGNLCTPSQITFKVWVYYADAGTPVNSSIVSFEIIWGVGTSSKLTYGAGKVNRTTKIF